MYTNHTAFALLWPLSPGMRSWHKLCSYTKTLQATDESQKQTRKLEVVCIGKLLARRVAVCLIGSFIYASGVCIMTKAALGISPITSTPYVVTLVTGLTLGTCTMILNVLLIAAQKLVFGKDFTVKTIGMQIGISLIFSVFIDLSIWLFGWFQPATYPGRLLYLVFGCAVLAAGMSLVVMANFVVLPGEGGVKCVMKYTGWEFGTAKILFDCTMVTTAAIVSLVTLGRLAGVREGTVIASILLGTFSKFIMRRFKGRIDRFLGYEAASTAAVSEAGAVQREVASLADAIPNSTEVLE